MISLAAIVPRSLEITLSVTQHPILTQRNYYGSRKRVACAGYRQADWRVTVIFSPPPHRPLSFAAMTSAVPAPIGVTEWCSEDPDGNRRSQCFSVFSERREAVCLSVCLHVCLRESHQRVSKENRRIWSQVSSSY